MGKQSKVQDVVLVPSYYGEGFRRPFTVFHADGTLRVVDVGDVARGRACARYHSVTLFWSSLSGRQSGEARFDVHSPAARLCLAEPGVRQYVGDRVYVWEGC